MTDKEALKLAKIALDDIEHQRFSWRRFDALVAINQALAQPEQEPWCMKINGCKTKCEDCPDKPPEERNFCPRCGKRTADLTVIHTCTPPIAAAPEASYGFPHGAVSASKVGGNDLTDGETSP